MAIFAVAALPAYFLAAATIDRIGWKLMQSFGFMAIAVAFFLLWIVPSATTDVVLLLVLFGATYFCLSGEPGPRRARHTGLPSPTFGYR